MLPEPRLRYALRLTATDIDYCDHVMRVFAASQPLTPFFGVLLLTLYNLDATSADAITRACRRVPSAGANH